MKKALYKILIVAVLAIAMAAGAVSASCNNHQEEEGSTRPTFEKTEYVLAQNQSTDYSIVIPDDADDKTVFAANELVYFFREATGATLAVYEESDVAKTERLIVIGDTEMRKNANIEASADLKDTGSCLQTSGSNVYLFGDTSFGDVNAVYDFLDFTFNYRFYAEDEIAIDTVTSANLLNFTGYCNVPDIDNMAFMYGELNNGMQYTRRLRSINYYQSWISDMYAHTYFKILPPATYFADHEDWYSPATDEDGNPTWGPNLCLTRSDEMVDEFVKRVETLIEEDETRNYFMLGQEDNFGFCDCSSCKAEIERLGSSSAVMMEFTNEVVERVNAWLEENYPERDVHFMTFAYNHTKNPPTKTDANGNQVLVSDSVKAADNLSVMFVINSVDYAVPYYENASVMSMLEGWSLVTDDITIWQYSTNFDNYMEPLFNWGTMKTNYETLSQYGVNYVVEQGSHNTNTATFTEMRLFVMSALARDTSLSTGELIDEFMNAYYKDAAPKMKELFEMYVNHLMKLVESGASVMSNGNYIMNANNWDYLLLERMLDKLDEALEAVKPLESTDSALYETLVSRIEKEGLWIRFCELTYHSGNFADINAARNEFVNDCYSYGITMASEGSNWDSVWS